MNLADIYESEKGNIYKVQIMIEDEVGREICDAWDTIKVYGLNNWKYFLQELTLDQSDSQLLTRWVCDQYKYFNNLSESEQNLIFDKVTGVLKKDNEDLLNEIIKKAPSLPIDLVVQFSSGENFIMDGELDTTKNILTTHIDTLKGIRNVNFKTGCCLNLLQLSVDTEVLIIFPTLDILIPKGLKVYKVGEKMITYTGDNQSVNINTSFLISLNDSNLIDKFCDQPGKEIFEMFSKQVQIMWILWSDYCLKRGVGNAQLASKILSYRK